MTADDSTEPRDTENRRRRLTRREAAAAAAAAAGTFGLIIGEGMPPLPRGLFGVAAAVFWVGFAFRVAVPPAESTPTARVGAQILQAVDVRQPVYLVCSDCGRPWVLDLTDQHVAAITCRHMAKRVEMRPGIVSYTPNRNRQTSTLRLNWPAEPMPGGTPGQHVTTTHRVAAA